MNKINQLKDKQNLMRLINFTIDKNLNNIPSEIFKKYYEDKDITIDFEKSVVKNVIEKKNRDPILIFIDTLPFLSNINNNKSIFNGSINLVVMINLFFVTINLYYLFSSLLTKNSNQGLLLTRV